MFATVFVVAAIALMVLIGVVGGFSARAETARVYRRRRDGNMPAFLNNERCVAVWQPQ